MKAVAPKLRPLKLPNHEVRKLSNGLTLHLVPRGPLPLVAVRLMVRGGSAFDLPGRLGVADFASRLLRRGAAGKSADQISDAVEFVGASVSGFANEENVVLSLSTPARHLEAMLEVLAELVMQPDFPEQEVELARRRTLANIANDLDDPGSLADRALVRALWGDHPYGHETVGSAKDLEALQRSDLLGFTGRLGPRISNLFIVGDANADHVTSVVERTLGRWVEGPEFAPMIPDWSGPARAGQVLIVDKPEQTQVQVRIGARGVKRGHPEHFPITVMNTILGGGFTSRLMTEIRVKRGLSYGAGSGFDMMTGAGSFTVSSFTRTETVTALIDVALAEIAKMRAKGATQTELSTAQRYISGLYPGRLETNEAVAGSLADVVHYALPEDWIEKYRERIVAVTLKDVADAAKAHLFEDGGRVLVLVGNAAELEKHAGRYGGVTVLKPADLA